MQPETNFHAGTGRPREPAGPSDREVEAARVIAAARLQSVLQYLAVIILVALLVCFATCSGSWPAVTGITVGAMILAAFAAEVVNFRLQSHLRTGWFSIFVTAVVLVLVAGLVLPTFGAIAAVSAVAIVCFFDCASSSGRVSRLLKKAGVRVGLMGASNEELRRLRTGDCFHCGYDMAGLPTPVCPECGKESRIEARA